MIARECMVFQHNLNTQVSDTGPHGPPVVCYFCMAAHQKKAHCLTSNCSLFDLKGLQTFPQCLPSACFSPVFSLLLLTTFRYQKHSETVTQSKNTVLSRHGTFYFSVLDVVIQNGQTFYSTESAATVSSMNANTLRYYRWKTGAKIKYGTCNTSYFHI